MRDTVMVSARAGSAARLSALSRCWRIAIAALAMVAAQGHAMAAPLEVFVSILPQKYFVERVGGDAVKVGVMVRPGQNPATYDPTPQQMVAVAKARAYFRIGVAFEDTWLPRMQAANPSMRIVDTRSGIALQAMAVHEPAHDGGGSRGNDKKPPGLLDPHIWTSPPLVKQQAATVRDALIALAPDQRPRFEQGYARFAADLDALDADIRKTLAGKKDRRFMVFHPAWGYFASAYGLQQVPIEVEGKEPGPQALARIIDAARRDQVRVVFVQAQFSKTAAVAVARSIGGEVVQIDPLAEDLLGNTRSVAQALARAMR